MSKAILMSIQPKWCELIASGKKTVDVRKTRPKLDTPFPVYIYQTKKTWVYNIFSKIADWQGKVIGECVCDKVDKIVHRGTCNSDIRLRIVDKNLCYKELDYTYLNECKLSYSDIDKYSNGGDVYGWHISNLVIYDEPKELWEFKTLCTDFYDGKHCDECEYFIDGRGYEYDESDCGCDGLKPLKRPPQSWCYVEELNNGYKRSN